MSIIDLTGLSYRAFAEMGIFVDTVEEFASWAILTRDAGRSSLSIGASGVNTNPKWWTFKTNDLDCFGTGAYNDLTPTETNTQEDGLLVIKKSGIYIVDYYVGWDPGLGTPFTKSISVEGGYGGGNFDVDIDRRDNTDFQGVLTEGTRDSQNYSYQHVRKIFSVNTEFTGGTQKGTIRFSMYNQSSSSKIVYAQFAGIVRIPSVSTVSSVVFS